MRIKSIVKLLSLAVLVTAMLLSCTDDASFGKDMEVQKLPSSISYPDLIVNESSYMESAVPNFNSNGHPVTFDVLSIRKGDETLDGTYLANVTVVNPDKIESTIPDANDPDNEWTVITDDLTDNGKIIIDDASMFTSGDYYFTVEASAEINGNIESVVFEDALHLQVGWATGIAYCPRRINFVSGAGTVSGPATLEGRQNYMLSLASDEDKLVIDPVTGVISVNPEYTITETETVNPTIKIVYDSNESVPVYVDGSFTAVLSTEPVELEKEKDYFFYPTLKVSSKNNVALGGNGYSRQFIEHKTTNNNTGITTHIKAGDPEETTNWFISKALWRNHKNSPVVSTPDAIAAREEAGVTGTQTLEHQMWTITGPSESWIIIDSQNLSLYEGCFNSKAVFWYKIFMNDNSGYEADGSTPIDLEVHISDSYTGDVTTTTWTQVNDILECEINDNGIIMTGTPYPGDQSGVQPPNGVKDPNNSPNNLWVRAELDLENYKTQTQFTLAFRFKTQYTDEPYYTDPSNGWHVLNGSVNLSNVHFVASEK